MSLTVLSHPLANHLLSALRDRSTEPERFRIFAHRLALMLTIEATRNLPVKQYRVATPLEECDAARLQKALVVVPILRAGLSMLQPVLDLFPDVSVGYVGLERDEATGVASSYYCKLPDLPGRAVLLVDPMLATGGSACRALHTLYEYGADDVRIVSVVAAPEGIARVEAEFPEVEIYTSAVDRQLNDRRFIVPGLGDFGDRLYGTV